MLIAAKFLRKVREYKAEDAKSEKVGATIVHCSAGVGRTGVTIALDAAAEKIEKNQKIDPRQLLIEMREQRGCLIQETVKRHHAALLKITGFTTVSLHQETDFKRLREASDHV